MLPFIGLWSLVTICDMSFVRHKVLGLDSRIARRPASAPPQVSFQGTAGGRPFAPRMSGWGAAGVRRPTRPGYQLNEVYER
jgi:hypothetical protein